MSRLLVILAPFNHKKFASSLWCSNFSYDPDKMRLTISWVIWTFCLPIKSLMCTYLCKKGEIQVRTAKEKKEIGETGHTDSSHFLQYFPHERHLWQTRPLTIMRSTSTSALRQSGVLGIPVLKTQSIALLAVQHRWSQFLQGRRWRLSEEVWSTIAMAMQSPYSLSTVYDAPYSWKMLRILESFRMFVEKVVKIWM